MSEETGTLSLANQGKLERPITSSRLQELLIQLVGNQNKSATAKSSSNKTNLYQKTNTNDTVTVEKKLDKQNTIQD